MKQILLLFTVFFNLTLFSQSKINGIGRFKIGMDVTIIDSLKSEGYVLKDFDREKDKYDAGSEKAILEKLARKNNTKKKIASQIIYEKKKSVKLTDFGQFPFLDKHKTYIIKFHEIVGIDIDYIVLEFYNNKLYKIFIDNNLELKIALDTKYKTVQTVELGKKVTCVNSYREVEYQESNSKDIYRDDIIFAYYATNIFYYSCKQLSSEYLIVEDKLISNDIGKCEHDIFMSMYNDPDRSDLKELKKL